MIDIEKYLNSEYNPEEEDKVIRYLIEHENDEEVTRILYTYFDGIHSKDDSKSRKAFRKISNRLDLGSHQKTLLVRILISTCIVASLVLFPLLGIVLGKHLNGNEPVEWSEIKMPSGQTRELLLSDGTLLKLGPETRITYPSAFNERERKVFVDGEIYAKVMTNPEIPFIIQSGKLSVKVFGTEFTFQSYHEDEFVELYLINGRVTFNVQDGEDNKNIDMLPGDYVRLNKNQNVIDLRHLNTDIADSYVRDGSISFENLTLNEITKRLSRIFSKQIIITDEALGNLHYYAYFPPETGLMEILDAINCENSFTIEKRGEMIYLK